MHNDLNATTNEKKPWKQQWAAEGMETVTHCPICESAERKIMHADLIDNVFFTAPGKWSLWECKNCRSAYLDPRPTPSTIYKAYSNYYTHQQAAGRDHYSAQSPLRKLRRRLVNGYINWRFGTREEPANILGVIVAFALPSFKKIPDRRYRHLPKLPMSGGVLLDLGCGDGSYLDLARSCGWQVVGLDPDPEAVSNATQLGLTVHKGGIEHFEGKRELFDVITLNHVIEHVHDPIKVLKECHTLLKPGGQLWVETPNIDSFGHALFKTNWRGLEAPRHLTLFNRQALLQTLISIGFSKPRDVSRPSPIIFTYSASHAMDMGYSPYQGLALPKMLRWRALKAIYLEKLFPSRREFLSVCMLRRR